jgi:hypothetical protein
VNYKKELTVQPDHYSLPETGQTGDALSCDVGHRRFDAAEHEWVEDAKSVNPTPEHKWLESLEIDEDIGELGHLWLI